MKQNTQQRFDHNHTPAARPIFSHLSSGQIALRIIGGKYAPALSKKEQDCCNRATD